MSSGVGNWSRIFLRSDSRCGRPIPRLNAAQSLNRRLSNSCTATNGMNRRGSNGPPISAATSSNRAFSTERAFS